MSPDPSAGLEQFQFRHLHPQVRMGTASDRYAGWVGQIYSSEGYRGRLKHRTKVLRDQSFNETFLPIESVAEYFEHFPILEIDFTFYRPPLTNVVRPPMPSRPLRPTGAICGMAMPCSSIFPRILPPSG